MIKKSLYLLVLGLIVYSLFIIITPYYHYYAFKLDLEETLRTGVTDSPKVIMTKILDLAEQYNIPIEKEDVNLRQDKRYVVAISWQETIDFFTVYQKTLKFHIDTSR